MKKLFVILALFSSAAVAGDVAVSPILTSVQPFDTRWVDIRKGQGVWVVMDGKVYLCGVVTHTYIFPKREPNGPYGPYCFPAQILQMDEFKKLLAEFKKPAE